MIDNFDKEFGDLKSQKTAFNDLYNAKLFVKLHGQDMKYCSRLGGWLIWDNTRWVPDELGIANRRAIDTVNILPKHRNEHDPKTYFAHVKNSGNANKIKSILDLAKSHPDIAIKSDQFDSLDNLLNCSNGTYDLIENKLKDHSRADLITKICHVRYDNQAKSPIWESFLNDIFENNTILIKFMQRVIGYTLTNSTKEQSFFILYGSGQNGKSTFLNTLHALLSDYAIQTQSSTFMSKKYNEGPSNDLARLKGAKIVTAIETEKTQSLDESMIKQITGGEKITARFLYKEFFEFIPVFKLFLATNHKPNIIGTDLGIWRRVKLIPFTYTIPMEKQDKNLDNKIKSELPGILNWAIEGYNIWKNEGLNPPIEVIAAIDEYREEEDLFGNFIEEECIVQENCQVTVSDIFEKFKMWAEINGGKYLRKKHLNEYLMSKGYKKIRETSGFDKGKYCWCGIGLKALREDAPF